MTFKVRRVITGHNAEGKAIVQIDELASNVRPLRQGANACVIWTTKGFPVDNSGDFDAAKRQVATSEPDGTVLRVIEYAPGVSPRNHRTDSIDYAVVISGEIDMQLDDTSVHLKAGDVLVQRGTIHDWVTRGTESCVIAFVLIGANPAGAGDLTLEAVG
jgi:quercetin dioxygenase-like cupin family protein